MKKVHNQKQIMIPESEYLEFLKLKEEIFSIKQENSAVKEENTTIKEEELVLEKKLSNLLEQLSKFKREKFGSTSEKVSDEVMEQMSLFFNEVEFTEDQFEKQTEEKEEEKTKVKGHDRKKLIDQVPSKSFYLKILKKKSLFMNFHQKNVYVLAVTQK